LQPTHPGALHADLYCADGAFDVANVAYHKDARVATELNIASDWERRTLWTGPLVSAPPLNSTSFCAYISFPPKFFALQSSSLPPYALLSTSFCEFHDALHSTCLLLSLSYIYTFCLFDFSSPPILPSFILTNPSTPPPPPQFESLDSALHDAFEAYLCERGIDGALAGFVPRYALWKEQRVSAVCVLWKASEKEKDEWQNGLESGEGSGALIWCDDVVRASDEDFFVRSIFGPHFVPFYFREEGLGGTLVRC
jgi:hypothetical protein